MPSRPGNAGPDSPPHNRRGIQGETTEKSFGFRNSTLKRPEPGWFSSARFLGPAGTDRAQMIAAHISPPHRARKTCLPTPDFQTASPPRKIGAQWLAMPAANSVAGPKGKRTSLGPVVARHAPANIWRYLWHLGNRFPEGTHREGSGKTPCVRMETDGHRSSSA